MTSQTPAPATSDQPPEERIKVLVVEDNDLNMKLFCDLLEAHDFAALQTRDGLAAIDIAKAELPQLILMDIQLPQISGLEITRRIKADALTSQIPIVAITAFAMKGDEEKVRSAGCEGYISKPISVKGFIQTVRQFAGLTEINN
ncbi:MAG: response regulator [Pseudomonadota bacterium]